MTNNGNFYRSNSSYKSRFINIYLNMGNNRKSYIMKWGKYVTTFTEAYIGIYIATK